MKKIRGSQAQSVTNLQNSKNIKDPYDAISASMTLFENEKMNSSHIAPRLRNNAQSTLQASLIRRYQHGRSLE